MVTAPNPRARGLRAGGRRPEGSCPGLRAVEAGAKAAHGPRDRRLGVKAGVLPRQPRTPGGVRAPLATQLADRRAVGVLDGGVLAQLERPAELLQAPAEVRVLRRPQTLPEAGGRVEGRAAHKQVRGRGARPERMRHVRALAEEVARRAVASGQRPGPRGGVHLADEGADIRRDAGREIDVEQTGRSAGVGVEEQDPVGVRVRGADVTGVRRRALTGCAHDAHAAVRGRRGAGVVRQDQLVTGPDAERLQHRQRAGGQRRRRPRREPPP